MKSTKRINFTVRKPYDYMPISRKEKRRIKSILAQQILSMANRFDGSSSFTIKVTAKGNI